jgi:cytochrome c biogenesis protein CcmG, thiol:disulfide interchange protein DsbE
VSPLLRGTLAGVVAAAFVAALAFGLTRDPRELPRVSVGRPAPAFTLEDLTGRRVASRTMRGRPMVVNFWASWCTECRKEHPLLMRAHDVWGDRVQFIGVVYQDSRANAVRFLAERGEQPASTYPNLLDPAARTAIDFGVYGVPETFFVDRRGRVVFKRIGRVTDEILAVQLRRITS